jgi:hypothetical protein
MKSPPKQFTDTEARELTEKFIEKNKKREARPRPAKKAQKSKA